MSSTKTTKAKKTIAEAPIEAKLDIVAPVPTTTITCKFQDKLVNILLDAQIRNLLHKIHSMYPEYFTDDDLAHEYTHILDQINNLKITYTEKLPTGKKREKKDRNVGVDTNFATDKCRARVFSSKYVIHTDVTGQKLYGRQCKNKKGKTGDYCGLHTKHCPHGDYDVVPTGALLIHFESYQAKKK
jgi:hypothetical protein